MGIVKLHCSRCGKLMTAREEHLGMAVRCPHCQAVVRLPVANAPAPPEPPPPEKPPQPPPLAESSPPSRQPSWLEEEPLSPAASEEPIKTDAPFPFADHPAGETFPSGANGSGDSPADSFFKDDSHGPAALKDEPRSTAPFFDAADHSHKNLGSSTRSEAGQEADFAGPPQIRHPQRGGLLVPILLLFLIPYCLATTGFIVWLIYQQRLAREQDPLERLPDPKQDEGGARQVLHKLPLPERLQTTLRQPVRVGALEVTPLKVLLTAGGDLVLVMDMHNVSDHEEFSPVHQKFAEMSDKSYTFLEPGVQGKKELRRYGGKFRWIAPAAADRPLGPGQHMVVELCTDEKDRSWVGWFVGHPQEMVWRVRVRRGLLPTSHGPRSATAVIGVRFPMSAAEKS